MDVSKANEQRQEALWRVFLMFVVIALVVARTGILCRGLSALVTPEEEPQEAVRGIDPQPCSAAPDDVERAVLAVLCLAEAAGRLFTRELRADWELMQQSRPGPLLERPSNAAGPCGPRALRLDTS